MLFTCFANEIPIVSNLFIMFAGEISHFAGEIKVFVGRPAPNTCHSCWVLAHLAPLKAQDFHQASLQQSDEQPRMFQHAIMMGVPTQRLSQNSTNSQHQKQKNDPNITCICCIPLYYPHDNTIFLRETPANMVGGFTRPMPGRCSCMISLSSSAHFSSEETELLEDNCNGKLSTVLP